MSAPLYLFSLPQGFADDHGSLCGAIGVHVAIDVRRGGDVAMTHPSPDQLHLTPCATRSGAQAWRVLLIKTYFFSYT